ncbi:methylthioribose kinase [Sutcliffiella cohnii]|uniref:Methylthioribose kinase n=1 Tax=Sutcliffiella cohnii TaxID=33932 RepID=A0A223KRR8_9BACI|nr:methylthioribose kinase [Sutcliffiella cohnii]AST92169.1 methylthioribose kinase [Sutcliffiella cohnii]
MIQRFIELGEGYSDLYELLELARYNKERVDQLLLLHTNKNDRNVCSFVVIMKPTSVGDFQALYMTLEGIPSPKEKRTKRFELFEQLASQLNKNIIELEVKPSTYYKEKELYYQYLTGVLRLNHILQPLK